MIKKLIRNSHVLVLLITVFISGCATLSSSITPDTDLTKFKTYYVLRHDRDKRYIDKIIQSELAKLGISATSGLEASKPKDFDVLVTYEDRWTWDITNYMINLTISIRNAKNNVLLASGQSYRPSLVRMEPEFMVREILESIFKKVK
jgi:hypothetical protein